MQVNVGWDQPLWAQAHQNPRVHRRWACASEQACPTLLISPHRRSGFAGFGGWFGEFDPLAGAGVGFAGGVDQECPRAGRVGAGSVGCISDGGDGQEVACRVRQAGDLLPDRRGVGQGDILVDSDQQHHIGQCGGVAGSAAKRMALTGTSVTRPLFRAFRKAVRPGHPIAWGAGWSHPTYFATWRRRLGGLRGWVPRVRSTRRCGGRACGWRR